MSTISKIRMDITNFFNKLNWQNLFRLEPNSRVFGFDRGTPIDKVYIEDFKKTGNTLKDKYVK